MMRKALPLLTLTGVMLLAFWKVIFHGEFTLLSGEDTATSYYPWFDVAAYWLKRGVLLFWDPYVYSGKFNMGEPQPGLYYPLNWVFMLLPARGGGANTDGMQCLMILDYLLASIFAFLLARSFGISRTGSLLAGVAFALGGYTAQIYGYLNVLGGFVWMPLVFLLFRNALMAGERSRRLKSSLGGGLALGSSFLAGHHIPPIHTGLLLLFYCVFWIAWTWKPAPWRRRFLPLALLGLVAAASLLATAFQWLPSAEWARAVYRWVGAAEPVKFGEAVPYSVLQESSNMAPQDVLSLLLPYVSVNANIYVGATVLFLALAGVLFARGRDAAFLTLAALVYFFLSWGRYSVIHGWVNALVPGLWFAREVFYYLIPFQLCLALLAGLGLDCLVSACSGASHNGLRLFMRRSGWTMAVLVIGSGALITVLRMYRELPMEHPFMTALAGLAAFLAVLGLLLYFLHSGRLRPAWFAFAAAALVVVDLSSRFSNDIRPKSLPAGVRNSYVRELWKERPVVRFLRQERREAYFRVDDPENVFPPNFGDAWRLDATMGHGATALVDYFRFRGTGWGPGSNASALLNAAYFLSRTELTGWARATNEGEFLYRNPRAVPRAFIAGRVRVFTSDEEMLSWIGQPLFNPRETVLLRESDLRSLPGEFSRNLTRTGADLVTRVLSRSTAAEAAAQRTADAEARYRMLLFQPPWGWSGGDRLEIAVMPLKESEEARLVINYMPGAGEASNVDVVLVGAGGEARIPAGLPGPEAGASEAVTFRKAEVKLGLLKREEYRLSVTVPPDCRARIDSLEVEAADSSPGAEDAGSVEITSHKPNRIRLAADVRKHSILVLSEVYYPGWSAWVDGEPAPLLKADYILRGIPLRPGKRTVELRFLPRNFGPGLLVSALALAAMALAFYRLR
ncbi:MAG: YfhO family protein [Acidobacteria bacterium]|nr:YfhO family protein [Acidobacteriota bacterium]